MVVIRSDCTQVVIIRVGNISHSSGRKSDMTTPLFIPVPLTLYPGRLSLPLAMRLPAVYGIGSDHLM